MACLRNGLSVLETIPCQRLAALEFSLFYKLLPTGPQAVFSDTLVSAVVVVELFLTSACSCCLVPFLCCQHNVLVMHVTNQMSNWPVLNATQQKRVLRTSEQLVPCCCLLLPTEVSRDQRRAVSCCTSFIYSNTYIREFCTFCLGGEIFKCIYQRVFPAFLK